MTMHPQAKAWIEEFEEMYPGRKILFLYKAGSHFFDLNTADSDIDYRGVYLPSPEEFLKNKKGKKENRRKQFDRKTNVEKNVKNGCEDVDFTLYSLTKVLELLKAGDFNMMELLFCPEDKILIDSELMQEIRDFKSNLLVIDPSSFLGFIKGEYKKYGVNVNHYGAQLNLLNFLKSFSSINENGIPTRISDIWEEIKEYAKKDNFISFTKTMTGNNSEVNSLKIAQSVYQWTVKLDYVIDALETRLSKYGHRQKNMAKTGKEYKGLYHALRLIYEASDLMNESTLHIPFSRERKEVLLRIKTGEIDQEEVHLLIDQGIDKIKKLEKVLQYNIGHSKANIEYRVDKILFNYSAKMELLKILQNSSS